MMACFNSSTLLSGLGHEAGLVCREPGGPRLTCLIPAHYQQLRVVPFGSLLMTVLQESRRGPATAEPVMPKRMGG